MAGNGILGRAAGRLGVAATVTLAFVAGFTAGGDSQAQALRVETPRVTIGGPGLSVDVPGVSVTVPAPPPPLEAPPPAPDESPATPVTPPSVRVELPELRLSRPPAPDPPPSPGPSATVKLPPPGGEPTSGTNSALPQAPGDTVPSRTGAGAPPPVGDSAAAADRLPAVAPGIARFPSRSELAKLTPAERRKVRRLAFDTTLTKQPLRKLRTTIEQYRGCFGLLPARGRRALQLRAGLLGRKPASRRVIAREIGMSPVGVLRLERSSLRRLHGAGASGQCGGAGDAGATATSIVPHESGSTAPTTASESERGGGSDRPAGRVLADVHESGPAITLDDGKAGAAETMLFFLLAVLALLGPLAAIAASRQRRSGAAPHAPAGERPLLFLDIDGVILLAPFSNRLPPGRVRTSSSGLRYLPDRAGELVRELATRFDIVWTSGWEHQANRELLSTLGLLEELPVLTFGGKARAGSSKWKIKPVDDYAGTRPAAWLDDHFVGSHGRWAAHRAAPTLLVRVDPRVGLAPHHVERLLDWADRLAPPRATEPKVERGLPAG